MRAWSSGILRFHSERPGKAWLSARGPAVLVAAVIVTAELVTACGTSSPARSRDALLRIPVPGRVEIRAAHIRGLGTVLVDSAGHALYMFPPDARRAVTCVGPCAGTWPPLAVRAAAGVRAGPGVTRTDLGTVADPNTGARDVTYNGYPLYRYAGDVSAGTADGQALHLNGGPWYVLNPHGDPVLTAPPYSVDGGP